MINLKKYLRFILPIINLIILILDIIFMLILNIIPIKYILVVVFILLLIFILASYLLITKKIGLKIVGSIISLIFIVFSIIAIIFINDTNNFFNKSFDNDTNYSINTYYIVSKNIEQTLDDFDGKIIGYSEDIPNIDMVLNELNDKVSVINKKYDSLDDMIFAMNNKELNYFIIEKTLYNYIVEYTDNIAFKVVYAFDVYVPDEKIDSTNKKIFNIYVGGLDFTEKYTDFNLIVTINMDTHKILLTSTPRDYYVDINGKDGKDLLGYAGVWGINTSIKTLEDLYDINIDYYVRLNTTGLVKLVDTLGTLEFCSDFSYTTTHATVLGTYDDTTGNKLNVQKGCHEYTGIEILTIARERQAYSSGDRQRQKNCQEIMKTLFYKLIKPENLFNYNKILDAVSNLYSTTISKELVSRLVKETINNPKAWTFVQQSVNGYNSSGKVHFSNYVDYVMLPDMDSVEDASNMIKYIMNEG